MAIVAEVGAEVIAGSTRMKAGTAQKMILNMLSTGAMARLGYVYGNLMVNVRPKNEKLVERGVGILEKAAGLDHRAARKLLAAAGGRVPVALVMAKAGVRRRSGRRRPERIPGPSTQSDRAGKAHVARRRFPCASLWPLWLVFSPLQTKLRSPFPAAAVLQS